MAKRRQTLASISQEQAHHALSFLVHEGKLAFSTVERALKNRERVVGEIRDRMKKLGVEGFELAEEAVRKTASGVREAGKATRKPRRRIVSAAVKAGRQAQGRYLVAIRPLSKSARKQIKTIREKSGVDAAIASAKKMAK